MRSSLEKLSTQILRFIPLVLAFLTPLFFLPITSDPYNFNKLYLVTALASLSLIVWCLRSLARGKFSLSLSPSLLPLTVLTLAFIVSSVWLSPIKHVSLFGQTTLIVSLLIIFISVTSSQKNYLTVNSIIFGLISSATILSLVTIFHRFDFLSRIISSDLLAGKSFNPAGGILSALVFTLPILISTVGYLIAHKNRLLRSLLFASIIAMIVASLINLTLLFPQSGQQVLFLLPFRAGWSIAIDTFKNWPTALLGFGPGTFLSVFTRLRPNFLNADNALWLIRFTESSSYFLTLITTTGIIGALSFFFAFIKPIIVSLRYQQTNSTHPTSVFLSLALFASLLSYLITPTGIVSLVLGFLLLTALTIEFKLLNFAAIKDLTLSLQAEDDADNIYHDLSQTKKHSPKSLVLSGILTVASIILITAYWYYAIPAYSASVAAKQAEGLLKTNPVGAYLKEINAGKQDPFNYNNPLSLSQFFKSITINLLNKKDATAEDKKNATDYMQRAIDYGKQAALLDSYNVLVWENLADIYQSFIGYAEGAQNFAVSHLAQAIVLDPSNPQLRLRLGVLFFNLGDSDQAIKIVSQATELKQNWDIPYYNISAIYKYNKDYSRALQYIRAGMQYTSQTSPDYAKVLEEIKSLEKLLPSPGSTPSATVK